MLMIDKETYLVVALVDSGKAAFANVTDDDIWAQFLLATGPSGRRVCRRAPRRRWLLLHSQGREWVLIVGGSSVEVIK